LTFIYFIYNIKDKIKLQGIKYEMYDRNSEAKNYNSLLDD